MAYAQTQEAPLEHAIITIARSRPAPGPRRSATVWDSDGVMYGIWPDKLEMLREGETFEVEFAAKVANGVTYRDIKHVRAAGKPSPAPAQFTGQHQPAPRSLSSAAVTAPEARPNGGNPSSSQGYYRPTSPRDAERMFVCSTLNAFVRTGRVDCERQMISGYINELRAAWAATFGSDQD